MYLRPLFLFLLIVSSIFVLALSTGSAAQTENDPLQQLIRKIEQIRIENKIAAVGLVIVKDGRTEWQGSLGIADKATGRIATEDTFYRIGSITKTFTAMALLKLQEQGRLKLTNKLSDYVSNNYYQNAWQTQSPITIEQLLEHTAGFTDISSAEFAHEDPKPISLLDGLAFNGEHHQALWQPGRHSSYSNLDTGFAGAVIEKITGKSFDRYLSEEVLEELAMNDSSTLYTETIKEKLATGYNSDGDKEVKYWHILLRPFGALNSSPKEMANALTMLIDRGRLNGQAFLTQASIERMESPRTTLAAKKGLTYGYGLGNYQSEQQGFLWHGHGGTASGFLARLDYLLVNRSGYVVMINSNKSSALSAINKTIREYLVADLVATKPPPKLDLTADIEEYLGYYQPVTSRGRVVRFLIHLLSIKKLTRNQQQLNFSGLFGSPIELVHQGDNLFRIANYTFADTALIKTDDGEIFLQNDGNYQKISNSSFYAQLSALLIILALTIFSLFYYAFILLKQLYLRRLPNKMQTLRMLRISPFFLFAILFVLLIFFSTSKGSVGAVIFYIVGLAIMVISILTFVLAFVGRKRRLTRLLHSSIASMSVVLGVYLYTWTLISQPIWS